MSGYAIRANASSDTLLSYVMFTSPDPLQASARNAILTLVVSNPRSQMVTVTSLVVTLPVGTNAKDLTADAAGVQTQPAAGWQASNAAGIITLTPTGSGEIGPDGLTFVFASVDVNAQVGLCTVTLDETASSPSHPAGDRTASIGLPKFPTQFQVGDLQAQPLDVPGGGSTTLMWTGTPATYTLQYQPADEGTPVSQAVGNTGPYTASNLTRTGQVTFTLLVQVPVPGLDTPLTVERQVSVTVETLSLTVQAEPPSVGVNGLVRLAWQTSNAASCVLAATPSTPGANGAVDLAGSLYFILTQQTSFTLTATDANGKQLEEQRTVAVDPTIVPTPNAVGYVLTGATGAAGADGAAGTPDPFASTPFGDGSPGSPGSPGGDALLRATLPPVGSGGSVLPITVTGGTGGAGGSGGPPCGDANRGQWGQGGNGGNASIDVRFSASAGPPAQYIVTVTGGAPGVNGEGSNGMLNLPSDPGTVGPIQFRDAD
ncbi:MAG TPA: hypothetical protein VLK84_16210 [Longimicrobium sp.]|nr:hypothetical protein [Longimicrobium sp.]